MISLQKQQMWYVVFTFGRARIYYKKNDKDCKCNVMKTVMPFLECGGILAVHCLEQ